MSAPQYHLPEDLLVAYAAGACSEAEALVAATHLTLCAECRAALADLEEAGGELLARASVALPAGVEDMWAALQGRLADSPPPAPRTVVDRPDLASLPPGMTWPRPLAEYLAGLRWTKSVVGVEVIELPLRWEQEPVRLFRLPPGFQVPLHTHAGEELQLVLRGGFRDGPEHYLSGDVAVRGPTDVHALAIDQDDVCITLNALSGPLVPRTAIGRAMRWLTGL